MEKILIADDEEGIRMLLKDYFEILGYETETAANGKEAIEKALMGVDLILLDINFPDIDGMSVCRKIRGEVSCPILFLTAKIEEQDKINGLLSEGDDYITKPFSIEELSARVAAHLRREKRNALSGQEYHSGGLRIRYDERSISYNKKEIRLTKTEFDIMEFLSMHPRQVFSKEQIYENVWGLEGAGDSSIVMEHIRRMRAKIAKQADRDFIETVWGVGYKWIG